MCAGLKQEITSDRIQDTLYAFMRSQILFSALDLDLFTHIADGLDTPDALAMRLNLSERGVRILLNGLVGIEFLKKRNNGAFELPPDAKRFLVKSSEDYMGGMVHHCKRLYENWSQLTDAVRHGHPSGGALSLAQLETYFSELVKGLYVSNYPAAQKLAQTLGFGKETRHAEILDVAGGSAVWSIAMLEADPDSRATVLDFPSVIHVAEEYVNAHGLSDRYTYWADDLEEAELPENHYDIAIMANICHALGPVSTQRSFQKLAKVLKPGGRLVVIDFVPDDLRAQPGWSLIFGVNMLVNTPEGDVFTRAEYQAWLKEAGLKPALVEEVETDVTVIVGQK